MALFRTDSADTSGDGIRLKSHGAPVGQFAGLPSAFRYLDSVATLKPVSLAILFLDPCSSLSSKRLIAALISRMPTF